MLIRFSSPGKVIYSHARVGQYGKTFECYKFRTMHVDADERLHALLQAHPEQKEEWHRTQKLKNDPRILGKLGLFLRKTSLDELPQFWNVLKGDLSVVGPRPITPQEVIERMGPRAAKILVGRPGLTGLWQTSERSNISSFEERFDLDERYINERNFWLDMKLILKTIPSMFFSKGAY